MWALSTGPTSAQIVQVSMVCPNCSRPMYQISIRTLSLRPCCSKDIRRPLTLIARHPLPATTYSQTPFRRKILYPLNYSGCRHFHTSLPRCYDEYENKIWYPPGQRGVRRTWNALSADYKRAKRRWLDAQKDVYRRKGLLGNVWQNMFDHELIPVQANFCIIGGGVIGSSIAYWLKQRVRDEDSRVIVIERDDSFAKSASVLGVGGIRQQFSTPELVQMSQFSAEFLRHAGEHLRIIDCDPPDISFSPMGYLFLADNEQAKEKMERDNKVQLDNGAKVKLMSRDELQLAFPFMNFDDIIFGSFGLENEGVFDPWSLLSALREKNLALGVQYIKAEVTGFWMEIGMGMESMVECFPESEIWRHQRLVGVDIKPQRSAASPRQIRCMMVFNCAGPWAGELASRAGIGLRDDLMAIPIPVEPRKRQVFVFHCPEGPGLDMPFLVDPSGVWVRREGVGHLYHCGKEPTPEEDSKIDHSNLDLDKDYFHQEIMPVLVKRVPAFGNLRLKNGWAGYQDYNTWDSHPVIGGHMVWENLINVCGFGGTGIQHAMAVGRAIMESVYDGAYININLRRFDMNRFIFGKDGAERVRL